MIYTLVKQIPIYNDETMQLVTQINSIILGEDFR